MNSRWMILTLLLAGGALAAPDAEEDLQFARRLGIRGLTDMAESVLDDMIATGKPDAVRAGQYGKALITKQQASLAKARFLQDLEEGNPPRLTFADVTKLYEEARPRIEDYVKQRTEAGEAAFLLAELLQEYAEFLTGAADVYDEMPEEREKLVDENKDKAAKLFEAAIELFDRVYQEGKAKLDPEDRSSELYLRTTNADYQKALARFRWALIYPGGPLFINRLGAAEEELDEFLNRHYEELFGAYAMLYLGVCNYERSLREGDAGAGQTALDYFSTLYGEVPEDPAVPETSNVLAQALYWYAKTANKLATGKGKLKKAQPIYLDNAIRVASLLEQKLKAGSRNHWALKAMLEVADAHAARNEFNQAVAIAGDALAAARAESDRKIDKLVTARLTRWVASMTESGTLAPGLLYQIGDSLNQQGRVANAITFYEKAISASVTDDQKDKWAYNAALEIARAYRRDKRLFAGAAVAWQVVQKYLASGEDEDSAFHQTASEACNQARLCWKQISEATKRSADETQYQSVLSTFRDKFPGHPENSDAAFAEAYDVYGKNDFVKAAGMFKDISPASRNYWRAQKLVPVCFRRQAFEEEAKAAEWHEKCLDASRALIQLTAGRGDDPAAQKAKQHAELYVALSLGSLERWDDALQAVDAYLADYPNEFLKKGLELKIKIDAHLAKGDVDEAEAALKMLKAKQPGSPYRRASNRDVYDALRKKYKPMGEGKMRTDLAQRAAMLWQEEVDAAKSSDEGYSYTLGDVLMDAGRYEDAAGAFEEAATLTSDAARKTHFKLLAAQAQFKKIKEDKDMPRQERIKGLENARKLFTDVLIPDKAQQDAILKKLADFRAWPSKEEWDAIKRRPDVLLSAAEVYQEVSPPGGLDGRWIAIRLIDHLQSFTRPRPDPANPQLEEFVPLWWKGTELKLQLHLAIKESGGGQAAQSAQSKGFGFGKKVLFEYPDADGPERAERLKVLVNKLQ